MTTLIGAVTRRNVLIVLAILVVMAVAVAFMADAADAATRYGYGGQPCPVKRWWMPYRLYRVILSLNGC